MNIICLKEIKKKFTTQSEKYQELRKQRGMTLLEIIIVLGIIGTISAGVVVLAQRAFDSKAIADLVTNTNIVRTVIKETYGAQGLFPVAMPTDAQSLTDDTITTTPLTPMGKLVALGKISTSELKNPVSGNYFNIGGAATNTTPAGANRGYFIMVNGLNQKQCRNFLLQVGNQWEFVEVRDNMPAGVYPAITVTLTAPTAGVVTTPAAAGVAASTVMNSTGVFRSMVANGNNTITPDAIITVCMDSSANGIILGSR